MVASFVYARTGSHACKRAEGINTCLRTYVNMNLVQLVSKNREATRLHEEITFTVLRFAFRCCMLLTVCHCFQVHRDRPAWADQATRASEAPRDVPVRPVFRDNPGRRVQAEYATAARPLTRCNTWPGYSDNETVQGDHKQRAAHSLLLMSSVSCLTMTYSHCFVCSFLGTSQTVQRTAQTNAPLEMVHC